MGIALAIYNGVSLDKHLTGWLDFASKCSQSGHIGPGNNKSAAREKCRSLTAACEYASVLYMMITIAVLTGVCLGYISRVFVERLSKPTTSDIWDQQEWDALKLRVEKTFGSKTDLKTRK